MSKYYIARNKDGELWVHNKKVVKNGWNFWDAPNNISYKLKENWFPEVKWDDLEPKILTIEKNPWIKVEDKLPNADQKVFVCCILYNNPYYSYLGGHMNAVENWYIQGIDDIRDARVIAWMPIPEFKNKIIEI